MSKSIIIIGAGIAGLTAALALITSDKSIKCTVYELRDSPSTIGGSVNLTPNALRLLSSLGVFPRGCPVEGIEIFSVHTGVKLGELPFVKSGPALRVMREELQRALLEAARQKGVEIVFGRKFVGVEHDGEGVEVEFANGEKVKGDLVLGCDGMHSAVRTAFVEPGRVAIYTGVAAAYSSFPTEGLPPSHFKSTALNAGRYGSLMTTFVDADRKVMSASAVMETPEQGDKEGWKQRGKDNEATMKEIARRFEGSVVPGLGEMVRRMGEKVPILFPVYKLGPRGRWTKGRVLLLGDAAHGMPPQGESTGLAIEDAVLFARIFTTTIFTNPETTTASTSDPESPPPTTERLFQIYENTRRARIDAAYEEALSRWENVRDKSWFEQKVVEFFTWVWLWWKREELEANFSYDVREVELVL